MANLRRWALICPSGKEGKVCMKMLLISLHQNLNMERHIKTFHHLALLNVFVCNVFTFETKLERKQRKYLMVHFDATQH